MLRSREVRLAALRLRRSRSRLRSRSGSRSRPGLALGLRLLLRDGGCRIAGVGSGADGGCREHDRGRDEDSDQGGWAHPSSMRAAATGRVRRREDPRRTIDRSTAVAEPRRGEIWLVSLGAARRGGAGEEPAGDRGVALAVLATDRPAVVGDAARGRAGVGADPRDRRPQSRLIPRPRAAVTRGSRNAESPALAGLSGEADEGTRTLDLLHGKQTL